MIYLWPMYAAPLQSHGIVAAGASLFLGFKQHRNTQPRSPYNQRLKIMKGEKERRWMQHLTRNFNEFQTRLKPICILFLSQPLFVSRSLYIHMCVSLSACVCVFVFGLSDSIESYLEETLRCTRTKDKDRHADTYSVARKDRSGEHYVPFH